tara:strand:+ start:57 stop:491 length:435 start_codon:yes stop_codon:yes gene_type:complete
MPVSKKRIKMNSKGRRISKNGHDYGLNLEEKVQMWRTPTAEGDGGKRGLGKMTVKEAQEKNRTVTLSRQVRENPTKMWPTPTTRDYKGGRKLETLKKVGRNENNSLPDKVNSLQGETGSLNPTWVEWLMGFPTGYTDSKHWETQ